MRYALFLFPLLLLLNGCAHHKPAPYAHAHWKVENRIYKETSKKPLYVIDVEYPEIISQPQTPSTLALNKRIHQFVSGRIQAFKDKAPHDSDDLRDYPVEMRHNEFEISYAYHLINPRGHSILSIRLETQTMFLGEAHRKHEFQVINYDLNQDDDIALASLFKPKADFNRTLAAYCQKQLSRRIAGGMPWTPWDPDASNDSPRNFDIWNVDSDGILITYQEYQLAPFSSMPQTILVPYSELRPLLADNSPITAYAYRS